MLNQGFLTDIEFVFSCMVHEHHTMLFSATMPNEIKQLSKNYLDNAVTIELIADQKAPQSLTHCFCHVKPHDRLEKLLELIETEKPDQAILFCSSRNSCEKLYDQLKKKIKSVEQIHGGMEQGKRTSLFRRFKKLDIQYLCATDIAARGLDFSHTTHIFNFDIPQGAEAYTHRTGRTARMGREGKAITFITNRDLRKLKTLLRVNKIEPEWIGDAPDLSRAGKKKSGSRPRSGKPRSGQSRRRKPRPKKPKPSE
jgi:ATP-dependent RNA helicase DeaD